MNFDNCQRRISEITDRQLTDLIGHQEENLWIEFKRQEYRRDSNDKEKHKREICKDVTAMANAEGGYIFIGIQEDNGMAQGFCPVKKPDKIENDVRNICRQSIEPAIQHLDVKTRSLEWNGKMVTLVIIHIPPSAQRPHGFKWKGTINFVRRYEDQITEYPMSELGEAFSARHYPPLTAQFDDKLDAILRYVRRIGKRSMSAEDDALDQDDVGSLLRLMQLRFEKAISGEPYYRIFAVPATTPLNPDAMPTDEQEMCGILKNPPAVRPSGFGVREFEVITQSSEGIRGTNTWNENEVILLRNGFLEFRIPLSSSHFQWYKAETGISAASNWLYPYAICEYPVTFMMLVNAIYSKANIHSEIHIQQEYHNLNGFLLEGGHPGNPFFGAFEDRCRVYGESEPIVSKQTVNRGLAPDRIAFDLVKPVYAAFQLNNDEIPLFDENHNFTP